MTNSSRRPLPGRIWGLFMVMVLLALLCLVLALVLGSHLRSLGPERGGGREGYLQVTRPSPAGKVQEKREATAEAQLEAMMDAPLATVSATGEISGTSAPVSESVPLEMPAIPLGDMQPTEVPPVKGSVTAAPLPQGEVTPLPVAAEPAEPLWQKNAVRVEVAPGAPMLALVIDDMGGQMEASKRAVEELPVGVTMSFFPWSKDGVVLAHEARAKGHEIMIHMPMEALPHGDLIMEPGPDALRVGMQPDEIDKLMSRNVAKLRDVAVGMNNHMGSRFTEWEPGLRAVLTVLQREGLLFLDSKTAAPTATKDAAAGLTLPVLSRDVFLDHVPTPEAVRSELKRAMVLARKRGEVVVIGHPLPVTLDVLAQELPHLVSSGIVLVPLSMLVK